MVRSFSLCILFGDKPQLRPPEQIGPGWDMTEIPVALQVLPFESEANWAAKKAEIASWNLAPIRVSSLNYFLKLDQPLEDIAIEPEYCAHVHIAEDGGQPGTGERASLYERLFRILRDMSYTGAVSCACAWVSTEGGDLDFGRETQKTLAYLQDLRSHVYTEGGT